MIFEGSEKKVEIIVEGINLLDVKDSVWAELVKEANATIISQVSNEYIKSYLLSESSLFVWEDRILLITCGQTTLISAAKFFLNKFKKENIKQLLFQRKNEYFSHMQPTNFYDDIKLLDEEFKGQAYRFGNMDEHHNFIYFLDKEYTPNPLDHTHEFLLYEICHKCRDFFMSPGLKSEEIRSFLKLDKIIPGFEIDDFVFEPYGYSLNAIKGDNYLTIHITPQETCPYISFETDINLKEKLDILVDVLNPVSFDFIEFTPGRNAEKVKRPQMYEYKSFSSEYLKCGYTMSFAHIYRMRDENLKPFKIL